MTTAFAVWRSTASCDAFHSRNLGRPACFGRRLNSIHRTNSMKTNTGVDVRALVPNHNEPQVRDAAAGLKVQTSVKAGALTHNHNEAQVRAAAPGLKVQTNIRAGLLPAV
jgi:hypothetical protein